MKVIEHVKELPVREIKKFVKIANAQGVHEAMKATPNLPFQKEFQEIESNLKKLIKRMKQLNLEGIQFSQFPENIQELYSEFSSMTDDNYVSRNSDERELDSLQ